MGAIKFFVGAVFIVMLIIAAGMKAIEIFIALDALTSKRGTGR